MDPIDKFISEALLSKKNIKTAIKANTNKFFFIPYVGSVSDGIKYMKEFSSYDELMDYFKDEFRNEASEWMSKIFFADNKNEYAVVGINTIKGSRNDMDRVVPKNMKNDFSTFYQVNLLFKERTKMNIYSRFLGWMNCSREDLQ